MRGQWFWQPDVKWLDSANMTNLRTLNAVRGFVYTGVVWGISYLGSVGIMWRAVWLCRPTDSASCSAALVASREASAFASGIFDAWALLVVAMGGFALGGAIGKRLTDTDYAERKARAKAGPQVITSEGGPVMASQTQQTSTEPGA